MKWRMVDRIVAWEPWQSISGAKCVSFEEYNLPAALGLPEQLPPTLVLQSVFELARWLAIISSDFTRLGIVRATQRVVLHSPVAPGERMRMDVKVRNHDDQAMVFDATGQVGNRAVIAAEGCLAELWPLQTCHDAADLRTLLDEIHRPVDGVPGAGVPA